MRRALGPAALAADARFATAASRAKNDATPAPLFEAKMRERTAAEWFRVLDAAQVPCEISDPKFSLGLHDDPEFQKRGWVAAYEHPFNRAAEPDRTPVRLPFRDTGARVGDRRSVVGQHSREILAELGYSPEQIEEPVQGLRARLEPEGRPSQSP